MDTTDEDDKIELSSHALAALKDFYSERDDHQKQFEALKSRAEEDAADRDVEPLTMSAFTEDWNASQFWYTQDTADTLARALLDGATARDAIAFVSAPSAFLAAKNLLAKTAADERPKITVLEYDERFAVFPEFVHFDYNKPFTLPAHLKNTFTRIIADPPFLSDECQTKTAMTFQWLAAKPTVEVSPAAANDTKLAICTGERMSSLIGKLYGKKGVRMTTYDVQHQKGLSNEFRLYSNFQTEDWQLTASQEHNGP